MSGEERRQTLATVDTYNTGRAVFGYSVELARTASGLEAIASRNGRYAVAGMPQPFPRVVTAPTKHELKERFERFCLELADDSDDGLQAANALMPLFRTALEDARTAVCLAEESTSRGASDRSWFTVSVLRWGPRDIEFAGRCEGPDAGTQLCEERFDRVFAGPSLDDARLAAGEFCARLVRAADGDLRREARLLEFDQACERARRGAEVAMGFP